MNAGMTMRNGFAGDENACNKFANCKGYLEDCELSGWDMSQGLPTHSWGLATDKRNGSSKSAAPPR